MEESMAVNIAVETQALELYRKLQGYHPVKNSNLRTLCKQGVGDLSYDRIIDQVADIFKRVKAHHGYGIMPLDGIVDMLRDCSKEFGYSRFGAIARSLGLARDIRLFNSIRKYSLKSL